VDEVGKEELICAKFSMPFSSGQIMAVKNVLGWELEIREKKDKGFVVEWNPPQGGAGRHLMVDVLGLALKVYVEAANSQDREGLKALAMSMKERLPRLKKIFADQGYTGECTQAVENVCGWKVEITKRSEAKVFEVQRKRWVVERTFGWFIHERRLSKDYAYWPGNSESMIYVSMIRLMLRRLAPAA